MDVSVDIRRVSDRMQQTNVIYAKKKDPPGGDSESNNKQKTGRKEKQKPK